MFRSFKRLVKQYSLRRSFGGHSHEPPGTAAYEPAPIPAIHTQIGKGFMVLMWVWVMYQMTEDNGKLFGLYKPWLDAHHDHEPHVKFVLEDELSDAAPVTVLIDEDEEDHEEGHEDDDEHDE
jgi:hypothetical protein